MDTIRKIAERTDFDSHPAIIHVISLRDGCPDGGWKRQDTSIKTMKDRVLSRWINHWQDKQGTIESAIRFKSIDDTDEMVSEISKERLAKSLSVEAINKLFPEKTEILHDSVWDFFRYIGYDYKDKKVTNLDTMIMYRERKAATRKQ